MTTIETERLLVRNFRPGDEGPLYETIASYERSEYAVYDHQWPASPEEYGRIVEWFASGDDYVAVCLRDTSRLIGLVTLPREEGEPDAFNLGYIFHSDYHGGGYAAEACRAAIDHAFAGLPGPQDCHRNRGCEQAIMPTPGAAGFLQDVPKHEFLQDKVGRDAYRVRRLRLCATEGNVGEECLRANGSHFPCASAASVYRA